MGVESFYYSRTARDTRVGTVSQPYLHQPLWIADRVGRLVSEFTEEQPHKDQGPAFLGQIGNWPVGGARDAGRRAVYACRACRVAGHAGVLELSSEDGARRGRRT